MSLHLSNIPRNINCHRCMCISHKHLNSVHIIGIGLCAYLSNSTDMFSIIIIMH